MYNKRKIMIITRVFTVVCAVVFAIAFSCFAYAESSDELQSVSAVEAADEVTAEEDNEADDTSELISESDLALIQPFSGAEEDSFAVPPETGVSYAIIPAAIALVVVIVMLVIKKLKKK